ncbi:MAG: transmembrane sensor [Crocinitomicaceae bacterium]|jgi:transmembrane sensor
MKHDKDIEDLEKKVFSKVEAPYSRSKEDIWANMEAKLETPKPAQAKIVRFRWAKMAAAASLVLLIGAGVFARLYTVNVEIPAGEFANHTLPDGSTVYLNAETSLNYHPYWWSFDRQVELTGEAFFEVKKGSKFTVESDLGTVAVLGTSFNIYSRDGDYRVFCSTGKVSVSDKKTSGVILLPGEGTILQPTKLIALEKINVDQEAVMAWKNKKFVYDTSPLSKVIEDLERHYNVKINSTILDSKESEYTGLFDRSVSIDEALEIICFSLGFEFEKDNQEGYLIKQ